MFFEDGSPTSPLTLLLHQRVQASLSTGAGGFGLTSVGARRVSASVGSMVATVPEVVADLSGATGENWRELPGSDLVRHIWRSIKDLRDVHGLSEEVIGTSCRKDGGAGHSEQGSKVPQGSRIWKCYYSSTRHRNDMLHQSPEQIWGNR